MIIYEGIFFDEETTEFIRSLEEKPLPVLSEDVHCTFKFKPKNDEIFNGNNSWFKIQLPEDMMKYYINYDEKRPGKLKVPHITTSLGFGATPMNTKDLDFQPLDKEYKIKGQFGFWVSTGYYSGRISFEENGE